MRLVGSGARVADCAAGNIDEAVPVDGALWRGYYDAAKRVLELYAEDKDGYNHIAKLFTREGWAFRDRWNEPRALKLDDVRRVTSAWREYAGLILQGKASQRIAAKLGCVDISTQPH